MSKTPQSDTTEAANHADASDPWLELESSVHLAAVCIHLFSESAVRGIEFEHGGETHGKKAGLLILSNESTVRLFRAFEAVMRAK